MTVPRMLSDRSIEMMKDHKSLFIQHYSFHTPVRDKYAYLSGLMPLFGAVRNRYPETTRALVRRQGFRKIYLSNREYLQEYTGKYVSGFGGFSKQSDPIEALRHLVEADGSFETKEIFRFEHDMNGYLADEKEEPVCREYEMDILMLIRAHVLIRRWVKICFEKRKDGIHIYEG